MIICAALLLLAGPSIRDLVFTCAHKKHCDAFLCREQMPGNCVPWCGVCVCVRMCVVVCACLQGHSETVRGSKGNNRDWMKICNLLHRTHAYPKDCPILDNTCLSYIPSVIDIRSGLGLHMHRSIVPCDSGRLKCLYSNECASKPKQLPLPSVFSQAASKCCFPNELVL